MKTWKEYEEHADLKTIYGSTFENGTWTVKLWHPFAKSISIAIYDKEDQNKLIKKVEGTFNSPNWVWEFNEDLDAFFYQFEIVQEDGTETKAMDPFAKSMAAFNWEGKDTKAGKAAFVKLEKIETLYKLDAINKPQPIMMEAHVRDLTSLRTDVAIPGSFNALIEIDYGKYLKDLSFTHVQLLPIHNCYTLDETNKTILHKGQGDGWNTNYNWGYDPHNYFSINGWYSSNPENPYSRINEFRELVSHFHKNDIKVINDVVYNHMFSNKILDSLIPGYYYRDEATVTPVDQPPLASNRKMARRIITESLKFFVEYFDVDGFRFDLLTFTDLETINIFTKELREIKPNIVLHGEAWDFTDLEKTDSLNKGIVDNDDEFAYFNDSTRNAIKGPDDEDEFDLGILAGNEKEFSIYLASIIGNIRDFKNAPKEMTTGNYHRFTETANNVLNYSACHDGHTLWDKINLTIPGDKITKFEIYRQAIMLQNFLPGRSLFLEGTEMLYTKPNDLSGQDFERIHKTEHSIDLFGLGDEFNDNTYKTTDYSNGLRWDALKDTDINSMIFSFLKELNKFRLETNFFNIESTQEINDAISFNFVSMDIQVIDFNIEVNGSSIRIIHNFGNENYSYDINEKSEVIFDSKINELNTLGTSQKHSTVLMKEAND